MSERNGFIVRNNILVDYSGPGGDVAIPDGVTEIGPFAFSDYDDPDTVKYKNLRSVIIPEGVTKIGDFAFVGRYDLVSVTIPESVNWIGEEAFGECTGFFSVTVPNSDAHIHPRAFWGCTFAAAPADGSDK